MCKDYVVNVRTLNSNELNIIQTDLNGKEYLCAKENSSFCVTIHNNSSEMCDVSLTIGSVYIGTRRLGPERFLEIKMDESRKEEFRFDRRFYHIAQYQPFDDVLQKSSIVVTFVPLRAVENKCIPSNSGGTFCYSEIIPSEITLVKIPVLLHD